jgi:Mg-chelatase subunit ChlD
MRRFMLLMCLLCLIPPSRAQDVRAPQREVEVCFVLDTTGSMGGLIGAAKEKIWFIANAIVSAPSKPSVRFCLIGFRDRGDDYVTRRTDLTADLDAIYRDLMAFEAGGGGDTPEAVNQALLEAVEKPGWREGTGVLRLIFLVGDAPPSVYPDEPQYPEIAERARARGILINPVQCGSDAETTRDWARIASLAGGATAQLRDAGAVARVRTPLDQDLAALNRRLGATLVPYGDAGVAEQAAAAQALAERMDDAGVSDRLAFKVASGSVAGTDDLVDAHARGTLDLERLDRARLPERYRSLDEAELRTLLDGYRDERAELLRVIGSLLSQRQAWLDRQSTGDGFDAVVSAMVRRQLADTSR